MPCSRRSLLQRAGAATVLVATGGAGCLGFGATGGYKLLVHEVPTLADEFILVQPTDIGAETHIDYETETKREWLAELFETGSLTAVQWPLVHPDDWGTETRPRPTFLQHGEAYHEVTTAATRQVERERWLFAVQRTDEEPPDSATVASEPFDLSERDREILQAALDAVYAGNDGFLGEPEVDGLQPVQYHQEMDPEASDLVPEPPFDYVDYSGDTYRVVVETASGIRDGFEWRVTPSLATLRARVAAGVRFSRPLRCDPDCVLAVEGKATGYPDGGFDPRGRRAGSELRVYNAGEREERIRVRVAGGALLDYRYRVPPAVLLTVPVPQRSGATAVRVDVEEGRVRAFDWAMETDPVRYVMLGR